MTTPLLTNPLPLPDVPGVTHRQVQVGDLSVHVAEAGAGDPVVLLHGWPQHWWCWRSVVPLLAPHYRLVMPDLRGQGWTSVPEGGYDKEQLATDLLGLLDALDLPRVGLVGHDWGGWTGFLACLRSPERFRGFVALGIAPPFQRLGLRTALNGWRLAYQVPLSLPVVTERVLTATPRLVEAVLLAGSRRREVFPPEDRQAYGKVLQDPERARATVALYRTFLLEEGPFVALGRYAGRRLTVPTRLVTGEGDPVAAGPFLDGWQDCADDMTADVLPGVGHFVPEEAPEEVAQRVRALLEPPAPALAAQVVGRVT